jgi:hypothetical protein
MEVRDGDPDVKVGDPDIVD